MDLVDFAKQCLYPDAEPLQWRREKILATAKERYGLSDDVQLEEDADVDLVDGGGWVTIRVFIEE